MSHRRSSASGRCSESTCAWKQVTSLSVNAFSWPPTASSVSAISLAEREGVPLKSMCSRAWQMPATSCVSCMEPTLTQMPTAAERT